MKICDHFQQLMLEHQYGLLDRVEGKALESHLQECGTCRLAMTRAEKQKVTIAEAAKRSFPNVSFRTPAPAVDDPKPVLGRPPTRPWARWCLAASILLLLGGLGIPSVLYSQQEERVALANQDLKRLREQRLDIHEGLTRDLSETDKQFERLRAEIHDLSIHKDKPAQSDESATNLIVTGPEAFIPGGRNVYTIESQDFAGKPVESKVTVRVMDKETEVFKADAAKTERLGQHRIQMPSDLPVKPESALTLKVEASRGQGTAGTVRGEIALAAPTYLTHLATDRPLYEPGQDVRFRSLTLERFSLRPPSEDFEIEYSLEAPSKNEKRRIASGTSLLADDEGLLQGPDGKPVRGIGAGMCRLPNNAECGVWTLFVREKHGRFAPQQRQFVVKPKDKGLEKIIKFAQDRFAPGDQVKAEIQLRNSQNKAMSQREVTTKIEVDGVTLEKGNEDPKGLKKTDDGGLLKIDFKLPNQILRGDANVTVTVIDGDREETLVYPVPVISQRIQVAFFPEGGDLVAGVPNRLYFQAQTLTGQPVRLRGRILDEKSQSVADAVTFHDDSAGVDSGLGAFTFSPQKGKKYRLRLDAPVRPEGDIELPAAKDEGVVLSVSSGVTGPGDPIVVRLHRPAQSRPLHVGLYCRGRLLDHQPVEAAVGKASDVVLRPETSVGGVYRVTVFEEGRNTSSGRELLPVAERLIYRTPGKYLRMDLTNPETSKGDLSLACRTRNEKGETAGSIVMVAAVDADILARAKETTFRSMPAHFLLATEVRRPQDLENADFMLGTSPKAREALDLLLGTQGWRRFAEVNAERFRKQAKDDNEQLLVLYGGYADRITGLKDEKGAEQDSRELLSRNLQSLSRVEEAIKERDRSARANQAEVDRRISAAEALVRIESTRLGELRQMGEFLRFAGRILLSALLIAVALACVVVAVRRTELPRALPYYTTALCSSILVVVLTWQPSQPLGSDGSKIAETSPAVSQATVLLAKVDQERLDLSKQLEERVKLEERLKKESKTPDSDTPQSKSASDGSATRTSAWAMFACLDRDGKDSNAPDGFERASPRKYLSPNLQAKPHMESPAEPKEGMAKNLPVPPGGGLSKGEIEGPGKSGAVTGGAFPVREYSEDRKKEKADDKRGESSAAGTGTFYWHPARVAADGRLDLSFAVPAGVKRISILAAGHTVDGRLGASQVVVEMPAK